jgi:hypothetical protein
VQKLYRLVYSVQTGNGVSMSGETMLELCLVEAYLEEREGRRAEQMAWISAAFEEAFKCSGK